MQKLDSEDESDLAVQYIGRLKESQDKTKSTSCAMTMSLT